MIQCRAALLMLVLLPAAALQAATLGDLREQSSQKSKQQAGEVRKSGAAVVAEPLERDEPPVIQATREPPQRTTQRPAGNGFFARPAELQTDQYRELAGEFEAEQVLQSIATDFNAVISIPVPVALRFAECGEPNAFYDSDAREVSLCFELIELFQETLSEQLEEDEVADALAGAMVFILLHEVGHALVDVLELPITGREEDAVDQLSAWMLIDGEDGDSAVLSAAATFYSDSELSDADFADEHSVDQQRYFNMVCWVYGSQEEPDQDLIDSWELPEERAQLCGDEYAQLDRSWTRLLGDHIKSE